MVWSSHEYKLAVHRAKKGIGKYLDISTPGIMNKLGTVCNFCRQGDEEASQLCGKLHVEKIGDGQIVAAHHKCMQYSAGLVQYKFDHFGGFKIDKVQGELKRGGFIKCHICKNDKTRKRKCNRATSGCAVKTCRKSFHYYCAKKSDKCITKRMLVRYKLSDEERVLYRVFCCQDHEKYFKEHKEDLVKSQSGPGSSDSDDLSDEDDDSKENESESDQTTDLDQTNILMTTLHSPFLSKDKAHEQDSNENYSGSTIDCKSEIEDPEHLVQMNSAEWQPEIVSIESLTNGEKLENKFQFSSPAKLLSDTTADTNDNHNALTCLDTQSDNNNSGSNSNFTECKVSLIKGIKSVEQAMISQKNGWKDKGKSVNTEQGTEREDKGRTKKQPKKRDCNEPGLISFSPKDSPTTGKHYADCVLVITNSLPCGDKTKHDIVKQLGATCRVAFWPKEEVCSDLNKEHLPYLMNDIVTFLSDNGVSDLIGLLTDKNNLTSRLLIHNYALNLHKKLEKNMAEILMGSLMKSIADTVKKIDNKQICQLLTTNDDIEAIAVCIDNNIDPHYKLRSALGIEEMSNICLHRLTGKVPQLSAVSVHLHEEASKLIGWIDNTLKEQPQVLLYPKETFLLDGSVQSVADLVNFQMCITNSAQSSTEEEETNNKTCIVCICRMDTEIVNYKQFCHKCILNHLPLNSPVIFVIDMVNGVFEDVDDFVPEEVKDSYTVDIYTANPPARKTMSSVLLHFYKNCFQQRRMNRMSKALKSPASSSSEKETGKRETSKKRYHCESSSDTSCPASSPDQRSNTDQTLHSSKRKRRVLDL
ncbi:uncharacterized protein LOC132544570 [Ylistrum balloti]|uniref:uncharacterized protein LOC132544570 n=1 Tax=Ylistrum balloti TaxID=509963 RepID=UPI002905CD03|nr:uncharacterized protein LOC132544570 [Ylistrum balloti]